MDQKGAIHSVDAGFIYAIFKLPFPAQHKM